MLPAPFDDPASVFVKPVRYPGPPNPRGRQIERTDIGPDRGHFVTLLVPESVRPHSGRRIPVPIIAPVGHLFTVHEW